MDENSNGFITIGISKKTKTKSEHSVRNDTNEGNINEEEEIATDSNNNDNTQFEVKNVETTEENFEN